MSASPLSFDGRVLVTRFMSPEGTAEVQDLMPVPAVGAPCGESRIVRRVKVSRGALTFDVACCPSFDYGRVAPTVTMVKGGAILEVRAGTLLEGPVRLTYDLAGFADIDIRLQALGHFVALHRLNRLPSGLFRTGPRARRWAMALQAWDGGRAGASQREIAVALFGGARVAADWAAGDHMRKRVARLVRTGDRLVAGDQPQPLSQPRLRSGEGFRTVRGLQKLLHVRNSHGGREFGAYDAMGIPPRHWLRR